MICFKKNWKNHFLNFFFSKSTLTSCLQTHVSQICAKKFKKLSLPVLWKRFEIKSHQRRAHYLNPPRNGGRLTAGGGSRSPPPVWLGLMGNIEFCPKQNLLSKLSFLWNYFWKQIHGGTKRPHQHQHFPFKHSILELTVICFPPLLHCASLLRHQISENFKTQSQKPI